MRLVSIIVLLLLVAGCPQPEDPGRRPVSPERVEPTFPTEIPTLEERIEAQVRWLEYGNPDRVHRAMAQLATAGRAAEPAVIRFLEERGPENPMVVLSALRVLESIGGAAGARAAAAWLDAADAGVRRKAVEVIAAGGGVDIPSTLFSVLDDPSAHVVYEALTAIGALKPPGAAAAVLARGDRYGARLAGHAARILGQLGENAATPWLLDLLEASSRVGNRIQAALALHALGDERGLDQLAREASAGYDAHWSARVRALLDGGHPRGRPLLEAARAGATSAQVRDARLLILAHPEVCSAAEVLAALDSGDEDLIRAAVGAWPEWLRRDDPELMKRVEVQLRSTGPPMTRVAAAHAMVASGRADLLDRVARAIAERPGEEAGEGGFAVGAARVLAQAGAPAVGCLLPLLDSENEATRLAALDGLVRVGGSEAAKGIAALLFAKDPTTRKRAAESLARLGSVEAIPSLREAHRKERDSALRAEYARTARTILGLADRE